MKPASFFRFLKNFPLGLVLGIDRRITGFYRACFLSALMGQPFFSRMLEGPLSLDSIAEEIGTQNLEALKAWLDFGVSLGVLKKSGASRYGLKDGLARKLCAPGAEAWRAYYRLRAEVMCEHIIKTPAYLADGKSIALRDEFGGLFADSSRTVEPVLLEIVGETTPAHGPCRLLEVGCGSGVYLRKACEKNPELTAVGLDMQHSIAEIARDAVRGWGLEDRVRVLNRDARDYESEEKFDIVTLHNLIYYFPKDERTPLLARLKGFLNPEGRIVMSTLCNISAPSIRIMNLWSAMTEGSGPLPEVEDLEAMLLGAGYADIRIREIIPAYWCAEARNAA